MNIEILRIHEDYVTEWNEWHASPGGTKFSKPIEEMPKKRTECFSEEVLHVYEEERWYTVSLQKFTSEIHLKATIDRFLPSLPLNKTVFCYL